MLRSVFDVSIVKAHAVRLCLSLSCPLLLCIVACFHTQLVIILIIVARLADTAVWTVFQIVSELVAAWAALSFVSGFLQTGLGVGDGSIDVTFFLFLIVARIIATQLLASPPLRSLFFCMPLAHGVRRCSRPRPQDVAQVVAAKVVHAQPRLSLFRCSEFESPG